ncbi:N-CoR GPS2-interacting domain, partial [Trinorchestia longiramus]
VQESSYYPQVEAISPTPPEPRDDSPDSSKNQILKKIESVDREIEKFEASIKMMEKKAEELEAASIHKAEAEKDGSSAAGEDEAKTKNRSLPQMIYAANKKKAEEAHKEMCKMNYPMDGPAFLPLYHQPSDTQNYESNKKIFYAGGLKMRLIQRLKREAAERHTRVDKINHTYSKLRSEWLKKVEKEENSKKHKEKVSRNRELFEKVFSELRKQREDRERFTRVGARVKSDAEMEEIMDGLQEQENEEKKMRSYAVIPPIVLDEVRRNYRYHSKNGLIKDPVAEYKEHKNINTWSEQEKDIFREKYLQHPKNFVLIASYLEKKTVANCIHYYYSTKKKENYKAQVKRRIRKPRSTKGGGSAPSQTGVLEVVGLNSTGVTTRGSVAALQKEQQQSGRPETSSAPNSPPPAVGASTLASSRALNNSSP